MNSKTRQRGVGLIEVLIAAVVLAFGILALSKLEVTFLRGGSDAKARTAALAVAEQKLEELRGANDSAASFAAIASGTDTPSGTGSVVFARSWTVTNVPATGTADLKTILVTVSWSDETNTSQQVRLSGGVTSIGAPFDSDDTADASDASATKPLPLTVPDSDDKTVQVTVGSGLTKETMLPLATYTNTGGKDYTVVAFSSKTYNSGNQLLRDEEFQTVNCSCSFNGSGSGKTPAHAAWNDTLTKYVDVPGDSVTKTVGQPANNKQSPLCDVCCLDHHDTTATDSDNDGEGDGDQYCNPASVTDRCYDPYRASNDYTGGKHNHYDGAYASPVDPAGTGTYLEACRFKLVDGKLQVYQDWHLLTLTAFPESHLDPADAAFNDYRTYVKSVVDAALTQPAVKGEALTVPADPATLAYNPGDGVATTLNLIPGDTSQQTGRGIYLDYLSDDGLHGIRCFKDPTSPFPTGSSCAGFPSTVTDAEIYLLHTPFYEVDATKLAQWASTTPAKVSVTSNSVNTNPSLGGLITVLGSNTTETVTAKIKRSNTGIVNRDHVDVVATLNPDGDINNAAALRSDQIEVVVGSGASGTFILAGSVTAVGTTTWSVTTTAGTTTCPTITSGSTSYSCSVSSTWTGSISVSTPTCTAITHNYTTPLTANLTAENFVLTCTVTVRTITGAVAADNGNTVTLAAVPTPSSGITNPGCSLNTGGATYTCNVEDGWIGTVTASATGCTSVTHTYASPGVTANLTGENFSLSGCSFTYLIRGNVDKGPGGAAHPSTTSVTYGSPATTCPFTASAGTQRTYTCTVTAPPGTVVTVQAGPTGSIAAPTSGNVTLPAGTIGGDTSVTGANFTTL